MSDQLINQRTEANAPVTPETGTSPPEPSKLRGRDSHANENPEKTNTASRGPIPFRFRDQTLLGAICAIAVLCMAVYCVRTSHWGVDPIELERQPQRELDYKIDLNVATWVEWSQLPGIGPVLANRIVEERERNGPFRDIDDLDRVRGIGPKKIEAIRPFVRTDLWGGSSKSVNEVPKHIGSTKSP